MRNLANWRKGSTPQSAEMIDAMFPDSAVLNFAGTDLHTEPPSMRTIRRRLKIARLAQHGYEQLLEALCGDENKLLQLLELFHRVYNLTIAASQHGDTDEAQDAWFEDQLVPWDKLDLLLSITPSCRVTACKDLAKQLTRKFMTLEPDSPLQDMVPIGSIFGPIVKLRIAQLRQQHEEDLRLDGLMDRVRRSSPWRALQAEPSYWVISQIAHTENLPAEIRSMAAQRLRELATTPGQTVEALMPDISFLILCEPRRRPKDAQQRVQTLLDTVEKDQQGYEEWRAPLLNLRAKHRLMQNDFEGARVEFKDALAACSKRNFGPLRGEVARDGWATEMASVGFIPNNQEIYYRHMLMHGMFSEEPISIEDAAVWCEEYFWNDLYHPYPDVPRMERLTKKVYEAVLAETFGLIETADWDRLRLWIKSHAKQLREANFKDARCNSVLLSWLKPINMFDSKLPTLKEMLPQDMASEIEKVETHMRNRRHAIALLLEAWPEQAKIADFKGQTPLHLVADNGDAELTRLLAPLSDLNVQDVRGRTVLHAAASGRSPECVSIVIERHFQFYTKDFERVTPDEKNTALHTAVRFGQPECVQKILDGFPSLTSGMNTVSQTPLVMAIDILQNLDGWRRYMEKNNRRTGTKEDFEEIIKLLESKSQPV